VVSSFFPFENNPMTPCRKTIPFGTLSVPAGDPMNLNYFCWRAAGQGAEDSSEMALLCEPARKRDIRKRQCSVCSTGFLRDPPDDAWMLRRKALRHSLFEGIQDGHIEVREITFVPRDQGEAMNASRGGHHGVLT
jgi:hypothetical protein